MSEEEKQKRERIKFLLEQNFPEVLESDIEALGEGFTGAHEALLMEIEAHRAVHVNDKRHRDAMLTHVQDSLLCGGCLSAAERAWLVYVLNKLDDMPCECKNGRPIDGNEEVLNRLALIAFIIDDEMKNPDKGRGHITARLKRAADKLSKSYEAVRKVYYSKGFGRWLEVMKERGFNPLREK